ncbi:MAG TPA: NTP transferase domain-containing protein [Novosphingobium sp.]|nr:NTP transferase domain-containing protein [Novosphingobium sp.]
MRTLGVILAGGASRRFGSDKALAILRGKPLIGHAIAALLPHCEALVVAGHETSLVPVIADYPGPGLGPLGGLAGAFDYGRAHGFTQILSSSVDCIDSAR